MKSQSHWYYTAQEAQARLGLSRAKFHKMVRQGLIPRVVLPGMKQGVYPRRDVDALALSVNEPVALFEFSPSSPADQAEEISIAHRYPGSFATFSLAERLIFQQRTHFAFYSLKVRSKVVASLAMFRLQDELIDNLLTGRTIFHNTRAVDVLPFVRLEPFRVYFESIMTDPTIPASSQRFYAGLMIYKTAELLLQLLTNSYQITGLYTVPYTLEGDRLVQKLGFRQMYIPLLVPERRAYEYLFQTEGLQRLQQMTSASRHFASSDD